MIEANIVKPKSTPQASNKNNIKKSITALHKDSSQKSLASVVSSQKGNKNAKSGITK